ncbi:hypothetical protein K435DRAFT_873618 [Dendrothele bispora CBS 962.96]|uniref:DUF6532 domain-containing protein n=1 Tax=Dendrothele bispora (strain CBS 962.96) TaxID=1314807 RepID=A0A4S8KYP8_DENBC|nr:hypothetical protein K435DRAFT_873618 [Dendrothele bispora CBS 962.96]
MAKAPNRKTSSTSSRVTRGNPQSTPESPKKKPKSKSAASKEKESVLGNAFAFVSRGVHKPSAVEASPSPPSTGSKKKVSSVANTRKGKPVTKQVTKQTSTKTMPKASQLTPNDYFTTLEQSAKKTTLGKEGKPKKKTPKSDSKEVIDLDDDKETMINSFSSTSTRKGPTSKTSTKKGPNTTSTKKGPNTTSMKKGPTSNTSTKKGSTSGASTKKGPSVNLSRSSHDQESDETDETDDEDHMVKMANSNSDEDEDNISMLDAASNDGDGDSQEGDQMDVEDVTIQPISKKANKKANKKSTSTRPSQKVALGSFSADQRKLADYGKKIARMGTCLGGLFLEDRDETWTHVRTAVKGKGDPVLLATFKSVERDERTLKRMKTYVGYGVRAVRYHLKKVAREMVLTYFGVLGNIELQKRLELMGWLQAGRYYHFGDLDMEKQTYNLDAPYQCPIIPQILCAFLYTELSTGDRPLLAYLKEVNRVPIHLLAMVVTTMSHIFSEHLSATNLVVSKGSKLDYSSNNSSDEYFLVLKGLQDLEENSPEYTRIVTKNIWFHVQMNSGGHVPKEVYDYKRLEAVAAEMVEYNFVEEGMDQDNQGDEEKQEEKQEEEQEEEQKEEQEEEQKEEEEQEEEEEEEEEQKDAERGDEEMGDENEKNEKDDQEVDTDVDMDKVEGNDVGEENEGEKSMEEDEGEKSTDEGEKSMEEDEGEGEKSTEEEDEETDKKTRGSGRGRGGGRGKGKGKGKGK